MRRRAVLSAAATLTLPRRVFAQTNEPLKIGHIVPYSGPASAYGAIGKGHVAYFKRLNDQGGINGRKIDFISLDDGYSPPKTVEQARRLVEQDKVSVIFNPLGTPNNTAIRRYMNQKKIPQLFVATGADTWGDFKEFPWTMGWAPSYQTEAMIYARAIQANHKDARIAVLYQNDDFGKDYLIGLKRGFGDAYAKLVIKEITYEVTDATIDSQAVSLRDSGATILITVATPKFAAQMIRKVYDIAWKATHYLSNVSISVGAVIKPAGVEKAVGIISSTYGKDATDPAWDNDPGLNEWRAFMKSQIPDGDVLDAGYVYSYGACKTMHQTLLQCGKDVSPANIMHEAANLRTLDIPTLLPGIQVNTGPTNFHPIRQTQLIRWTGSTWERFGPVLADS